MSPTSSSPDSPRRELIEGEPARDTEARRRQLGTGLADVRARVARAAGAAGRDPREITLIAVTKTYPAADVLALAELGVADIGENRDQEARAKVAEVGQLLAGQPAGPELRWHFVGQLQTRKARSVAGYAAAVHSVDRSELAVRLGAAVAAIAGESGRPPLDVFIQVSLDGDPARGGAHPDAVVALGAALAAQGHLRLRGVMAVAPLGVDPDRAFARLAEISGELRQNHPSASMISAGMSVDLEQAIEHGSTHVRVGSALLGRRGPVFG